MTLPTWSCIALLDTVPINLAVTDEEDLHACKTIYQSPRGESSLQGALPGIRYVARSSQ